MAFEEFKENTEDVQQKMQSFIESNVNYYKLKSFKTSMKATSTILKFTIIVLGICMVLLFFSIALAFALGTILESNTLGFLIVGVLYLVVTFILYLVRDRIIEKPLLVKFSKIVFNN
ncbi:phage holin family protein [Flavobacterium sp. 14A]|uniref:phage holin family protein n=1 Tax=Flavobacterium sp. 14A TaxID=2735896 RepID=UPI00156ED70C|nr:phage holin family protein [Flavobacterium sp. 14A]NRT13108.1 putative membrane protein YdbT with pleckstrin-like domain [Flavobacterium sp. 14A]